VAARRTALAAQLTVHLRGETATSDSHAHVQLVEAVRSEEEDGLEDLGAEGLRLHKVEGHTVHAHDTLSGLDKGDSHSVTLQNTLDSRPRSGAGTLQREPRVFAPLTVSNASPPQLGPGRPSCCLRTLRPNT
jgi:hypothetical protein